LFLVQIAVAAGEWQAVRVGHRATVAMCTNRDSFSHRQLQEWWPWLGPFLILILSSWEVLGYRHCLIIEKTKSISF
jgi:hypothetical protein